MTDEIAAGLFHDLSADPAIRAAVLADANSAVDDFAARHGPTRRRHYANVTGNPMAFFPARAR